MTERPFSERSPEGHARIVEALHRYNVGPDWTRAECVDMVREIEHLRAELDEAQLRSIEARNPGIDMDEVRRLRAHRSIEIKNGEHDRAETPAALAGSGVGEGQPRLVDVPPTSLGDEGEVATPHAFAEGQP